MEIVSESKCFGGQQRVLKHFSESCNSEMTFGLFLPPAAEDKPVHSIYYLAGLTCTPETGMHKTGIQRLAAHYELAVVFPDTSPRGDNIPDDESYDLGQGAGFYVDALSYPWKKNFQMYTYVSEELPSVLKNNPSLTTEKSLMGHSMGGHGALTIALKNPTSYRSASAFAPIAHPCNSDWGRKQFRAYLGEDESLWRPYDTTVLLKETSFHSPILIDQGGSDQYFELLGFENLKSVFEQHGHRGTIRKQEGYDHGYYFISSFIESHVAYHAEYLKDI